jgi:hypothetical protein
MACMSLYSQTSDNNKDVNIDSRDFLNYKEMAKKTTSKELKQEKPYILTGFTTINRVYWIAYQTNPRAQIFFYANKDFTLVRFIEKKNVENSSKMSYSALVKKNMFKHLD